MLPTVKTTTASPLARTAPIAVVAVGALGVAAAVEPVGTTLAVVGALTVLCAVVDERTRRIPNRLVLAILVATLVGIALSTGASGSIRESIHGSVAAALIGGGPILFLIWAIRPQAIGGGDWKLLLVASVTLGLVDPLLAPTATMVACGVQCCRSLYEHRGSLPFAWAVAAGYGSALCLAPWLERSGGLTP